MQPIVDSFLLWKLVDSLESVSTLLFRLPLYSFWIATELLDTNLLEQRVFKKDCVLGEEEEEEEEEKIEKESESDYFTEKL